MEWIKAGAVWFFGSGEGGPRGVKHCFLLLGIVMRVMVKGERVALWRKEVLE